MNASEEFKKFGLMMKTVRMQRDGRIREAMSFETIDYYEVYECAEWFESRLYEIFSSKFLFIVFKETTSKIELPNGKQEMEYQLDKVGFWTMPISDLDVAYEYWSNTRRKVINNTIRLEHFWKSSKKKKFHVRPKARQAIDLAPNPQGGWVKKYCYWFNRDYVMGIIEHGL